MLVDYHVHVQGHNDREYSYEELSKFVKRAEERGLTEIGLADHDRYWEKIDLEVVRQVARHFPGVIIRVGLEVGYVPGKEEIIRRKFAKFPLDYVIGSIHEINGWYFDHPAYIAEYTYWDPDELYECYFSLVEKAVKSGLFDIVGHLDLIKIFNVRPRKPVLDFMPSLLKEIKNNGLVVEVNVNGLNKPVKEIYPEKCILEKCFQKGIPVTLSSDAHKSEDIGKGVKMGVELLREVGYKKIAGFERRKIYFKKLG